MHTHTGGAFCTPVPDDDYQYYQILEPAPKDPVPPVEPGQLQGDGQRCVQSGTLTPIYPSTPAACFRACSYKNSVPQPGTYFNYQTVLDSCYCVGPACDVIYDSSYAYYRVGRCI